MLAALIRVWVAAVLLALVTAHPAVRHSIAWGASLIVPFELSPPWHPLEQPASVSKPVRDGLA